MLRKFILSTSAIALGLCGLATPALANAPDHHGEAMEDTADTASGPALWKLADEDTTIYLFGTVHFLPQDTDWYAPAIQQALESSDTFVSEIDTSLIPEVKPGEMPPPEALQIAQMMQQLAMLEGEQSLRDLMTEEDRAEYEAALTELGVPPEALDPFEPWFAFINIQQLALMRAGFDPSTGVERVLDLLVVDKERVALETVEQQFGLFDGLSMEAQLAMLDESVEEMAEGTELMNSMIAEWVAGDPDGLAELINASFEDEGLYEVLLSQRNRNWADWIEGRMAEPGTVFMAVGAGHLAGRDSVQDLLAAKDIEVERVDY